MFIRYYEKNGKEYAEARTSKRTGSTIKHDRINLGRVIDKDKNLFQKRGGVVYKYTIEKGSEEAHMEDLEELPALQPDIRFKEEREPIDFGDSFFLTEYLKKIGLSPLLSDILPDEKDTVISLLLYKIVTDKKASMHAHTWWVGNYACFLYPKADLRSQNISKCLEKLGSQSLQQRFFKDYLDWLYCGHKSSAFLIDSTGLQSASRMQLIQVSNHNGVINLEARLIFVVDRKSGMPVYFRLVQGNVIDVTTLISTIQELKAYKVSVEHVIMDAGYFSDENAQELIRNNIPFITRVNIRLNLVTGVTGKDFENVRDMESAKYAVFFGKRLVYIRKEAIDFHGHTSFLYICVDSSMKDQLKQKKMLELMEDHKSHCEIDKNMAKLGMFVLFSSIELEPSEVLPIYYTWQLIEQVFDVSKNYADILPLRISNEKTLSGHLFLCFIATAVMQKLVQDIMRNRKKKSKLNQFEMFMSLRNHKSKVFDQVLVPYTAAAENNELYKMFTIAVPTSIPWKGSDPRNDGFPKLIFDEDEGDIIGLPIELL